jgi:BASS family bile acid:Na+ symporter
LDLLIDIGLPLALSIILLSLGLGLDPEDFTRVFRRPRAFAIGAFAQVVLLPLAAFGLLQVFTLPPELAVGVMLLSLCPGGATSNILSRLARADVALSVSLTAMTSLLSIVTVPILAAVSVRHFMGAEAPDVSVTGLALAMFLITTLPVALGVTLRALARDLVLRVEPVLSRLAVGLFVLIVVSALAANWTLFVDNLPVLGEVLIALNVFLLAAGLGLGLLARLSWAEAKTISIEAGIQNATLGITLAGLVAGASDGIHPMALPAGVYGITMFLVAAPVIAWFRRQSGGAR